MPKDSNKIIEEIIDSIAVHVESFISGLPKAQRALFSEIVDISKEFIVPARTVKEQAYNLKLIGKLDDKIKEILITKEYQKNVDEYLEAFDEVSGLQNKYFASVSEGFKTTILLKELKKNAVDSAIEKLTGDEIHGKIATEISDILRRGVNTSKSYSKILQEINKYINGEDGSGGVLKKKYKAFVNDAINVFAAEYTKAVSSDLGLRWFLYVGSLKITSRDLCKALIAAKGSCMPYIHESQLNDVSGGFICGEVVSTQGLYPNTNGANFQQLRGGYNCGHQLFPVSEFVVPKELRDKFK